MQKFTRALRSAVQKVVYPMTIASMVLGSLGSAALPAHAAASTFVFDLTQGNLRLKQSSAFQAVAGMTIGSSDNAKTLTSLTVSFNAMNGTAPTWTASASSSSELLDLAATNGGVSLWKESGGAAGFQSSGGTTDTQQTLAASPTYGASNAFTMTPATPPTLATDETYYVVLKSDTSGVTNNNAFNLAFATSAIVTSGTSPTLGAAFQTPPIVMDTAGPTITSVQGSTTAASVRVFFSEQVQKSGAVIGAGDFTYVDGGGVAQTISSVSHTAGQNQATLTMSAALDAEDVDATPATLASAVAILDMAGNAASTTAVSFTNPVQVTSATIPLGTANTAYSATLTASGGSGTVGWQAENGNDATTLSTLGLTLGMSSGALSGTVPTGTAGKFKINVRATDVSTTTATVTTGATGANAWTVNAGSYMPANGDVVLFQTGSAAAVWGVVTDATSTNQDTFKINNATLTASTQYRISKPRNVASPDTSAIASDNKYTQGITLAVGDLVFYPKNANGTNYDWGLVTTAATIAGGAGPGALQITGAAVPTYTVAGRITKIAPEATTQIMVDGSTGVWTGNTGNYSPKVGDVIFVKNSTDGLFDGWKVVTTATMTAAGFKGNGSVVGMPGENLTISKLGSVGSSVTSASNTYTNGANLSAGDVVFFPSDATATAANYKWGIVTTAANIAVAAGPGALAVSGTAAPTYSVAGALAKVATSANAAMTNTANTKSLFLNVGNVDASFSPQFVPKNATTTVTVVGTGTTFSGASTVQMFPLGSDIATSTTGTASATNIRVSSIASTGAANLSFSAQVGANVPDGAYDVKLTTGTNDVFVKNALTVGATGGAGGPLALFTPANGTTDVSPSPRFSFATSSNTTVNSYRITVRATQDQSGTALWDYVLPKTDATLCSATQCSVDFGHGTYLMITQPSLLNTNTTYYWQVRSYSQASTVTAATITAATALDSSSTSSFTTTGSVSDFTPPQVEHRPVYEARANAALTIYARVLDNVARTDTTPALSTTVFACQGSGCSLPASSTLASASATDGVVAGISVGSNYFSYTIPVEIVGATAGTVLKYHIVATDGTNTTTFRQPSSIPFQFTTTASVAGSAISGTVKDSTDVCSTAVRQATVFAEGTGFNTTSTNDVNCTYSLTGLTTGAPYNVIAVKDAFSDGRIDGVPTPATSKALKLRQGTAGGFGGDSTRPHVKFSEPREGMQNMPGNDSNFRVMVAFDKSMSQTSVTSNGNMTVSELNVQSGELTNITTTKGAWTYNPTFTMPFDGRTETNVAVWALSAGQTLGDSKTFAVTVTSNVVDSAGNSIQGNQSDGSFTFMFTTGSTTNFATSFNAGTNTFTGGEKFGEGNFIPPHVVGTTPSLGALDVPRNSKININFDRPMADDGSGYTLLSNVKLFEVTGTAPSEVETDVSSSALNSATLSSDKMIAQVTLKSTYNSGLFGSGTRYRIKVLGGAKGASGLTLAPPTDAARVMFMSDFKAGTTSDTVAPTVTGSFPDSNATSISPLTGAISVSFDKAMDTSTITTSTFTLTAGSSAVSGDVEYRPFERTAFFFPKSSLTPSSSYTITLTTSVKGLNGVALAATTRTFTTGTTDTSAPSILSMNADDNNVAITFSKPMNASKATDTSNFTASVLRAANYTVKVGDTGFNPATAGNTLSIPATASYSYDPVTNTVIIQGYRSQNIPATDLRGKDLYISLANVKDVAAVAISTTGDVNTATAPIQNSGTTQGNLGPRMAATTEMFEKMGEFRPDNFSSQTFGFVPQVEVRPFNMTAGRTTIYQVRVPISKQIPSGGKIVLTFPTGFDVSAAQQDVNSPKRRDINGPGTGSPTFKCQTNVTTNGGKSCGGGAANADDTGSAQGELADDGIVVSTTSNTVTIYINGATNSAGHDFLDFDISGVKNSTSAKDFSTSGYIIDVKTKNGTTALESFSSTPFFIQSGGTGSNTVQGTITATGNTQAGTMKVYLDSPQTGPLDTTSVDFAGGATATYSFTGIPNGIFFLRTDPYVKIGTAEFIGKVPPERLNVTGATTKNFTLAGVGASGTTVTIAVDGPSGELIDIFAGSEGTPGQPSKFRVLQKTLDSNAGAENFTIKLDDGKWFMGVGPQMATGTVTAAAVTATYLPPKPRNVQIAGAACTIEGTVSCTTTFTLTATTKTIQGLVKDVNDKVVADAEVYAYSPQGGTGNRTKTDTTGAFSLGVVDGLYNVGTMIPGMPPSKESSVEVTSHATAYLKIAGAQTAITPAAAATSFVLKMAKADLSISGNVTDGTSVIQGASVFAYQQNAPGNVSAVTDSTGNYTLYVSAGTWKVGAHVPQYGRLSEQTVTITTSNASNINFTPTATGTFYNVSGTVTAGGANVQGAFVRIRNSGYFNETQSGSDGTYTFKVPAATGYIVDGFIPNVGQIAPLAAFAVTSADVPDKNLTVAALRTVTISFVDSLDAAFTVDRVFVEMRGTTGEILRKEFESVSSGTLSAPDGSYITRVDLVGAPIPFTSVAGADVNTVYSTTTGVVVVNGTEGLKVTIPTLRTITFTVTKDSANVADAFVDVSNTTSGEHFGGKTGTAGTVTLKAADGTYFVNAMKPGSFREPTTLIVNAATGAQAITLSAASKTISGTVLVGSTGAANAFVRAERQGGGFAGAQADANGAYTLSVNEGIWTVTAIAEGYAEKSLTEAVDVTSASASGKNITLTTTVTTTAPKSQPMTPSTGGTVEDTTSGVKLNVPANALGTSSSAGNMSVKKTNNFVETNTSRPLIAIEISATDSNGTPIKTLNESVTVEITQTKTELAAAKSDSDTSINTKTEVEKLDIAYWDESVQNWPTIPTTVTYYDSNGDVLTAPLEDLSNVTTVKLAGTTDHFSLYAPVVPTDPSAPSTPTGLSAGSATTSALTLSWTAVAGATGYDIYRSTTSTGTFSRIGSEPTVSSGSTTSYQDTGLTSATTYYYKISSLNNNGESTASSAIPGTTANGGTSGTSGGSSSSGGTVAVTSTQTTTTTTTETKTTTSATTEKAWGFKDGKFQLMPKTEADALHEAGEAREKAAAKKGATPATPAQRAIPGISSAIPASAATPPAKATKAERISFGADTLVKIIAEKDLLKLPAMKRALGTTSRGDDVKTLQYILQSQGLYTGKLTGAMNKATRDAIKQFQLANKIATAKTAGFGNIGPATRAFINSIVKEAKAEVAPTKAAAPKTTVPKEVVVPVKKAPVKTTTPPPTAAKAAPSKVATPAPAKAAVKETEPAKKDSSAPKGESALEKLRRLMKQ